MLKSKHVMLTPLELSDFAIFFNWINDREQVLLNSPYKPVHNGQHRAWFEDIQKRNDLFIFAIRLLGTEKLIGSCQLHSINHISRSAELQIRFGDVAERGKGYGQESVHLLLDFGFKDLNLHRISLHVFSTNTPAIMVYQKAGFVQEGLLRQAAYINGSYVDVMVMSILRAEYVG